jgi:nicotinamidase-related amidase
MPRQSAPLDVRPPQQPRARVGTAGKLAHSKTVLLLVDFINPMQFPGAQKLARGAVAAARATATLKARMKRAGATTIYANDNYGHWRSAFQDVFDLCIARGGAPAAMAEMLRPSAEDVVILKPRQSAFYGTPLDLLLAQMRTQKLVVAGLATDICVQLTAMDATLRGYQLWVPADCTAAESATAKRASLRYMKQVLEARIERSGGKA